MGDLGLHAAHVRSASAGLKPTSASTPSSRRSISEPPPTGAGGTAPCDTWDNAVLHAHRRTIDGAEVPVPVNLEMKRLAPGRPTRGYPRRSAATGGVRFTTKGPKTLLDLPQRQGAARGQRTDLGFDTPFPTDAPDRHLRAPASQDRFLQMWAAYLAERAGALERALRLRDARRGRGPATSSGPPPLATHAGQRRRHACELRYESCSRAHATQ